MRECDRCNLGSETRRKGFTSCIRGVGDDKLGVMIVGEAPGQEEARRGLPFVGPSGMLLEECIEKVGYFRDDVIITNIVRCQPPANRDPSVEEINACAPFLEAEIKCYNPKVILALGAFSTKYFLVNTFSPNGGEVKISEVRGYVFETYKGYKVIPAYHPASVLRRPEFISLLQADINKVFEVAKREEGRRDTNYYYTEDFGKAISLLKEREAFSFDIETDGLNPFTDPILCCAFTFSEGSAICLPFSKGDYKTIFQLPAKKITHGDFDIKFPGLRHGLEVKNWYFNTMTAHHLLDENSPHGLKVLASLFTDVPYYNLPKKEKLSTLSPPVVHKYNCYDSDVTFRLYNLFNDMLIKEKLNNLYFDRVMPLNRTLLDIESKGVRIDINKLRDLSIDMSIKLHRLDRDLRKSLVEHIESLPEQTARKSWHIPNHIPKEQIGKYAEFSAVAEINWNSPKQVGKILFTHLGLMTHGFTPKGAPSVKDFILEQLKGEHEIPRMLKELRGTKKGLSTYLDGGAKIPKIPDYIPREQIHEFKIEFLRKLKEGRKEYVASSDKGVHQYISPDGRIHGDYLLHGTTTGRLSSAKPNLQNVPREGGYRSIYIADNGFEFAGFDYKQIELRVAAHEAGDEELLEILNKDDSKVILTELVTGRNFTEVIWIQTKAAIYGVLYGRGAKSLAEDLKISDPEADALIRGFFKSFPKVQKLINDAKVIASTVGVLKNAVGRQRRFPFTRYKAFKGGRDNRMFFAESYRQAINFWVQSLASDILSEKTIIVHDYLKEKRSYIVLTLHDALYLNIAHEEKEVIDEVKELLEKNTIIGDVLVECKTGKNWEEC